MKGREIVPGPVAEDEKCQEFAANLKRMLDAFHWSRADLARTCNFSPSVISNILTFQRAPTVPQGEAFDNAFGLKDIFAAKARAIRGESFPVEFGKFSAHEETAVSLHVFGHSLIPGLLQTEDYAREVLNTRPGQPPAEVERLVAARMGRQAILTREDPKPPVLWALVDESVLERPVAPAPVMYRQCMHLVGAGQWPNVRLAVVPYRAGGHSGLLGAFVIAKQVGGQTVAHLEDVAGGRTTDDFMAVREATLTFESLQMECLPVGDSRDLIARKAEEVWKGRAPGGARALTVATTAESV